MKNYFALLFSIVFLLILSNSAIAQSPWPDSESQEIITNYIKTFNEIDFIEQPENYAASGNYLGFKNASSNASVSISLNNNEYSIDEYLEQKPNLEELKIGNITIYIYSSDKPNIDVNGKYAFYESRAWALCGDYEIVTRAYTSLFGEDVNSNNIALMNTWARYRLVKSLTTNKTCGVAISKTPDITKENLTVEITNLSGEVEIKRAGSEEYIPALKGMILNTGDYISTGFDSTAEILVNDLAHLKINQITHFSIDQLFYDNNLARTQIMLYSGEITSVVNPAKGVKADFKISTHVCTIGVRGTEFSVEYHGDSENTNVEVYEGSVVITPENNDKETTVSAGSKARVDSKGDIYLDNVLIADKDDDQTTNNNVINIFIIIALCIIGLITFAVIAIVTILIIKKRKSASQIVVP
jgi:hypothetical protein